MIRRFVIAACCATTIACAGSDAVEIHQPLGGFPQEPSTVDGRVDRIDENLGLLVVAVRTVDGVVRRRKEFVYIDQNTIFTNSGGVKNISAWHELTGADIVIKGWYRDDRYVADEIDVVAVPATPFPTPIRGGN